MTPLTIDAANGMTISIADDLGCLSVAAYPRGECDGNMANWYKFENGAMDRRVYGVEELITTLQELSA